MSRERHEAIGRLFQAALDQAPHARAAWLEDACAGDAELLAELRGLVAADAAEFPALDMAASLAEAPLALPEVPGYRLLKVLGEGGMGTVYAAEQDNPRRIVALKVLRAHLVSPSLLKRFVREAHVLGQLQHENIARIYDAGQVGGHAQVPYFAMELIDGAPLLRYCAEQGLGLRERLELFARICDAIQFAHLRGVIHRDLKPANIYVTRDGQPKILDFGVARVTDEDMQAVTLHTHEGQIVGTVPYMSPEQASGDVGDLDVRSDVYTLGVVLYELLAGRLPLELGGRALPEALRVLREVEPPRLGSADPRLRGDLEVVVHKALAKERERRYQSAAELAADLRRYLVDQPIEARATSTFYQLRKFARRNRALVTGASMALLALVVGTVVSLLFAFDAAAEERRANREAEQARTAASRVALEAETVERFMEFLLGTFKGMDLNVNVGEEPRLSTAMDSIAVALSEKLEELPEVRARLHGFLGNMYRSLGRVEEASQHLETAVRLYHEEVGTDSLHAVDALSHQAFFLFKRFRLEEAAALAEEVRGILARLGEQESPYHSHCLITMGEIAFARRDHASARRWIEEALALQARIFPGAHEDRAIALLYRGELALEAREYDVAESALSESLAMRRELYGERHPLVAESLQNLSRVNFNRGDIGGAAALLSEAVAIRAETLPAEHPAHATGIYNLGMLNMLDEKLEDALEQFSEAERRFRTAHGERHPKVAAVLMKQAQVKWSLGELEGIEKCLHQALAILAAVGHTEEPEFKDVAMLLARVFLHERLGLRMR